jgi:hypothetical protein
VNKCLISVLAVLCLTSPAYSQKAWEKKPYQQWSNNEAMKILTDSPWAQTSDLIRDLDQFSTRPGTRDLPPSFAATIVRLRSALPVRQAFVRLKQLSIKYDKLKDADKASYDAEFKEFLECPPCAKYYIVTIEIGLLNAPLSRLDPKKYSLTTLQSSAFLANDKGEWRECVHTRQENREILFFFPRLDGQGNKLITSDNKEFYFTLSGKVVGGKLEASGGFVFEVPKLTLNGDIIF